MAFEVSHISTFWRVYKRPLLLTKASLIKITRDQWLDRNIIDDNRVCIAEYHECSIGLPTTKWYSQGRSLINVSVRNSGDPVQSLCIALFYLYTAPSIQASSLSNLRHCLTQIPEKLDHVGNPKQCSDPNSILSGYCLVRTIASLKLLSVLLHGMKIWTCFASCGVARTRVVLRYGILQLIPPMPHDIPCTGECRRQQLELSRHSDISVG